MRALFGLGLMVGGGVVMYGAATGTLAPMLAALFAPSELVPASGNGPADYSPMGISATALKTISNPTTWLTAPFKSLGL